MDRTPFAGLTRLSPSDPIDTDGASFQSRNPSLIDRLLEIGAVTHRHDAHAAITDPVAAPSGSVDNAGGTIPSDLAVYLGYTLRDEDAGETVLSDVAVVSTGSPVDPPGSGPQGTIDYTGGGLLADTYYYAITLIDGGGGQTPMSPWVSVEREPGYGSGQVQLSGLSAGLGSGAVGWRLFRARGGTEFDLLAEGNDDTFTDDGTYTADCTVHPPGESTNTTNATNRIYVTVPSGGVMDDASSFRLYASLDGSFLGASLVGEYPVSSAGVAILLESLDVSFERPPLISTAVGGASKIDPDTDILDWHWKRPVGASAALGSGDLGDVRLATANGILYGVLASAGAGGPGGWTALGSAGTGGGGGGSGMAFVDVVGGATVDEPTSFTFEASGGVQVDLTDDGDGAAHITITTVPAEQGPPGASGAPGADGSDGLSAYEIAVGNGFSGTEAEWLISLIGPPGAAGASGAPGAPGAPGSGGTGGGSPFTVFSDDGTAVVHPASGLHFSGLSGGSGVTVIVEEQPGGSAVVHIGASAATGPPGPPGADSTVPGPQGDQGDPGADGDSAYEIAVAEGFVGNEAAWLASLVGAPGDDGEDGAPGTPGAPGAPGGTGPQGAPGSGATNVADLDTLLYGKSYLQFEGSASVRDLGGGSAEVSFRHQRLNASGVTASLASGASGSVGLPLGYGYRLYKIRADKSARVQVYTSSAAQTADASRAIGTDPSGDHGVLLDFVLPAADLDWALSPQVNGANLEEPPIPAAPVRITNMAATGVVTVSFIYVRTE